MFNNVGTAPYPRLAPNLPLVLYAAFQLKFAIITPALISGAFAERIRFWGYLLFMGLFSLLIYCPLAHWTWHPGGELRELRPGAVHRGSVGRHQRRRSRFEKPHHAR